MGIRQPVEAERADVRALWVSCFPEGGPAFVDWYFSDVYRGDRTLCMYDGGALASALQMIPYTLSIRGREVPVHTLTGVSTLEAYRNRGLARALMAEALEVMAGRGLGFTFLYPFDHVFYQRLGWEACSTALEYVKPAAELPDGMPAPWRVETPAEPDIAALSGLYERFMAGRNCFAVRCKEGWRKRIGENRSCGGFILLARRNGEPAGYALCEEQETEIDVTELVCDGADAAPAVLTAQAVLAALKPRGKPVRWTAPADDRVHLLGGHWKDGVKLQPHVMFRVVDVPLAFRQAAPACDGGIRIEITGDNMRPANNGRYLIRWFGKEALAERTELASQFSCGIGTLARILTGFIDAEEAVSAGLAQGERDAIQLLNAMYPRQNNFLFEMY